MQASDIPGKLPIPFANGAGAGYIRPIPTPSQTGGAASFTDGFPPLNFQPVASGGIPPFGQDMNGILNQISAWARWTSAGGPVAWDAAFSSVIGGYPVGALVEGTTLGAFWVCTVDNNTSNPNTGGAGWQSLFVGLAPIASPTFTGTPKAPTAAAGTNTTQLATTAFLAMALTALNFGSNGSSYFQIPNPADYTKPWIVQFASVSIPGTGGATWTYPKPFPNTVNGVIALCNNGSGTGGPTSPLAASSVTKTNCTLDFHLDVDVFTVFAVAIGN